MVSVPNDTRNEWREYRGRGRWFYPEDHDNENVMLSHLKKNKDTYTLDAFDVKNHKTIL